MCRFATPDLRIVTRSRAVAFILLYLGTGEAAAAKKLRLMHGLYGLGCGLLVRRLTEAMWLPMQD